MKKKRRREGDRRERVQIKLNLTLPLALSVGPVRIGGELCPTFVSNVLKDANLIGSLSIGSIIETFFLVLDA
jgi:hypothetical protein